MQVANECILTASPHLKPVIRGLAAVVVVVDIAGFFRMMQDAEYHAVLDDPRGDTLWFRSQKLINAVINPVCTLALTFGADVLQIHQVKCPMSRYER